MSRILSLLLVIFIFISGVYAQTPPTPTELHVTLPPNSTGTSAYLTWHASEGSWQFRVYRSANDTSHFAPLGTTGMRSFVDPTIVRGTRYYYFVKSFVGTTESGRSNVASFMLEPLPPLPTPSNLIARLVPAPHDNMFSVRMNWNGGRGPWRYRVYRSVNDTLHYRTFSSTSDTTFTDFSVRADSTYYYFVRASQNDTILSPSSNTASVHVVAPYHARGIIRGTVVDDLSSAPLRNVMISFFRNSSICNMPGVRTDSLGRYSAVLDSGRYIVRAALESHSVHDSIRYRSEYFDNCPEPACATVIVVRDSTTFTANFGLARVAPPVYVYIRGVVSDTANVPLRNATVSIIRTVQEMNFLASLGLTPGIGAEAMGLDGVGHARGVRWTGRTDSLGRYAARVVGNTNYIALASREGFLPEYYNNKTTVETADIIILGTRDTSGINFSLAVRPVPNNSVSGVVRDSLGTLVPSRIALIPVRNSGGRERYIHTDSLGAYSITGVVAGKYFVLASPFSGFGHAFYKAGAYGIIRIQDADTVNVIGNVTGINVGVRAITSSGLTQVNGTIRNGAAPISGVRVAAMDATGELLSEGITDRFGSYTLDAVASGVVTVLVDRNGYNSNQTSFVVGENVYTINNVNLTMSPNGVTSESGTSILPGTFALNQNYPNPFNPTTTISFQLPTASRVSLKVFNVLGQEIATIMNDEIAAGNHELLWSGKDNGGHAVASGIYFYRMSASASVGGKEFSSIRKMLLLK